MGARSATEHVAGPTRERAPATGRPPYKVVAEDLELCPGSCPRCGGPRPLLVPRIAPDQLGNHAQGPPVYDLIPDLAKFILPRAYQTVCSRCAADDLAEKLCPRHGWRPVESDNSKELAMLRAALAGRDGPAPEPEPEQPKGALFRLGKVVVSDRAGAALWRVHDRRPELRDHPGASELGRPFAGELLRRHQLGDHGLLGRNGQGDPAKGRMIQNRPAPLDVNAASLADKLGSVVSVFRLEYVTHPDPNRPAQATRPVETVDVHVRTELGLLPISLVFLSEDLF